MRHILSVAATVLILSAVVGWVASSSRTSGSAFAQMLERVTTARTARFITRMAYTGEKEVIAKTTLLEPGWMRQEFSSDKLEGVQIMNLRQGKMLILFPKTKQAQMMSIEGMPEDKTKNLNIIDEFRDLDAAKAELLGEETVDGKKALKYRYKKQGGHYVIWLAADDKQPLKVTMSASAEGKDDFGTFVMTDFEWNVPVDESQFSFEIPEGYAFDLAKLDMANTTNEDFITMLRVYVRLNDDTFPDELNPFTIAGMGKLFADTKPGLSAAEKKAHVRQRLAYAYERPELAKMTDEEHMRRAPELGMPIARGAMFMAQLMETHDWHYLGKGVTLGEADKIVAWWTPKELAGKDQDAEQPKSATVLYGDLRIETKPAAELPQAP